METLDYLPISMLNHLEYCHRRFWLVYVQNEMDTGDSMGDHIEQPEQNGGGKGSDHRLVYVWSGRLRLAGLTRVLAVSDTEWVTVEYRPNQMERWLKGHIQLCAQALCLEERTKRRVAYGEILYRGSRRRERVIFTPELRERTEAAVTCAFALLESGRLPLPIAAAAKCRDCPLESACLPREALLLAAQEAK